MIEPEQDAAETQILRAPLSRDTVIAAGVGFADEQGLDKLTMRKLAERLGVEAMSLYNHVKNKDDLLDGMVNAVIGEIALPQVGENWQAQMRLRALSAHATLLRHPWATLLIVSRMTCGLPMLRYMEASIGCLREAGFSYAMVDHAITALDGYVYGFSLLKSNYPVKEQDYAQVAGEYLPLLPHEIYPYTRAMAEEISSGRSSGIIELGFGLDLILGGLEVLRQRG